MSDRPIARRHTGIVDEQTDLARVAEVEHRREQRQACDLVLAARGKHGRRAAEHRTAYAKAECIGLVRSGHRDRHIDRAHDTELEIVIPGQMTLIRSDVAP